MAGRIGRIPVAALHFAARSRNDTITELGAAGERLGRLLQEGGVVGRRERAGGGKQYLDLTIVEL